MSDHGPAFWTGQSGKRSVRADPKPAEDEQTVNEQIAEIELAPPATSPPEEPAEATDAAKALAAENNIDLSTVTGTGAGGRITQDDVRLLLPDA
jgi:pyruvate/2-oxoglutarate dehydrogenase complex dihydrolipoamide acyltransferase (E2) component